MIKPLALGIAGKLLKGMSLSAGSDWSGVLAVLEQEVGGSMEESIIASSLREIRGPHRDDILGLFRCFALVPEDTFCPLDVLRLIFEASQPSFVAVDAGALAAPPVLSLRRWLKILIDRSLVLGTVDRPSLHVYGLWIGLAPTYGLANLGLEIAFSLHTSSILLYHAILGLHVLGLALSWPQARYRAGLCAAAVRQGRAAAVAPQGR
jgi:hypothetical protein